MEHRWGVWGQESAGPPRRGLEPPVSDQRADRYRRVRDLFSRTEAICALSAGVTGLSSAAVASIASCMLMSSTRLRPPFFAV